MREEKKNIVPDSEIREDFVRSASGPGGQHVNRTSCSVRLFFNIGASTTLRDDAKDRLRATAGSKLVGDEITILAREHRSLQANREAARARLEMMVRAALKPPKKRHATKPTRASKKRRLDAKSARGAVKAARGKIDHSGD